MSSKKAPLAAQRRKARHYAMQALYQWHMAGANLSAIEAEFRADNDMTHVDVVYFHDVLHGVPPRLSEYDELITPLLDRALKDLDPVSLALLRMACYEFSEKVDVPYKVVISESVALSKKFGPSESHKFINGVLDKMAGLLRKAETTAG